MKEIVGLRSYFTLFFPQQFKRDALMFNRIGVPDCEGLVGLLDQISGKDTAVILAI